MVKRKFNIVRGSSWPRCPPLLPSREEIERREKEPTFLENFLNGLHELGYGVSEEGQLEVLYNFRGYQNLTFEQYEQLKSQQQLPYSRWGPSGYKIKGEGIEVSLNHYSRQLYPGYIPGETISGVKGYIELPELDGEMFEKIEQLIKDSLPRPSWRYIPDSKVKELQEDLKKQLNRIFKKDTFAVGRYNGR